MNALDIQGLLAMAHNLGIVTNDSTIDIEALRKEILRQRLHT